MPNAPASGDKRGREEQWGLQEVVEGPMQACRRPGPTALPSPGDVGPAGRRITPLQPDVKTPLSSTVSPGLGVQGHDDFGGSVHLSHKEPPNNGKTTFSYEERKNQSLTKNPNLFQHSLGV